MAGRQWSDLFKGDKPSGSFSNVVVTDASAPTKVQAGQRLVIDTSAQAFTVDTSLLVNDDDAFQIIDSRRTFDQNAVTIHPGDGQSIPPFGATDVALNMIGAGQVWEFVLIKGILYATVTPDTRGSAKPA